MASNDMELIMYKVLRYLYDCAKNDKAVREADFCYNSRLLKDCPESYWRLVIEELVSLELVRGVLMSETKDGAVIDSSGIKITFKGVQFLKENSRMQEAKRYLGKAFEIVLESIIASI